MANNMKYLQMKVLMVLMSLLMTTMSKAQVSTSDAPKQTVPVEEQIWASTDKAEISNNELLKGYVQQRFDEMLPSYKKNLRRSAAEYLSGNDLKAYNYLKGVIQNIARGKTATGEEPAADEPISTIITIPLTELTSDVGPWTAEDLGVDAIIVNGALNPAAKDAVSEKVSFDFRKVIGALLVDCPYELYWYDKTRGCSYRPYNSYTYNTNRFTAIGDATFTMNVAQEYAVKEGNVYYPTQFNADKVASVDVAIENAKSIVEGCSGSTLSRLVSYKERICKLTSYNNTAANNSSYPYGDPWQLVWVFDGDESTKVVCEGYSKAFKYLCDLSEFQDAECLIATGYMNGGTGAGNHMWNIMKMDDGRSYLIDVTNCDEGTIGAPDLLFMAYGPSGDYSQGYTFPVGRWGITYTYDDDTKATFSARELTISETRHFPNIVGDVNGDGNVTIGDIVAVVNIIAGSTGNYNLNAADANNDGTISVGDIVAIVNIMSGNN